jgi:hypothetical protein
MPPPGAVSPAQGGADVSWNMASSSGTAPRSTVVALVGADSEALIEGLVDLPAVLALSLREADPAAATRALAAA